MEIAYINILNSSSSDLFENSELYKGIGTEYLLDFQMHLLYNKYYNIILYNIIIHPLN